MGKFVRDNGDVVEVDLSYRITGSSSLEITECAAWLWESRNDLGAQVLTLTDAEMERIERDLYADPTTWDYGDDY